MKPRRVIAWLVFLLTCAAFGVGKPIHDAHWSKVRSVYVQSVRSERLARATVEWQFADHLSEVRGKTPQSVESQLGLPDGHLSQAAAPGRQLVTVDGESARLSKLSNGYTLVPRPTGSPDPLWLDLAGWRIKLIFYDGKFRNGTISQPPTSAVPEPNPVLRQSLGLIATGTLFVAPFVWLGAMLAGWLQRSAGRTVFGEVALAAAIAGSVAWAVTPGVLKYNPATLLLLVGAGGMVMAARMIFAQRGVARARRLHKCRQCNYDLTGNESGVCPECGTVTADGERRDRAARAQAAAASIAMIGDDGRAHPD